VSDHYLVNLENKSSQVVRTESRFFDITDCNILTDGHIDDNDGLIPNAIEVTSQEVADLVAQSEARSEQLESVESLLKEWIEIRRARLRRAKNRLLLQKNLKEVAK
jgi:hypothetical protein